MIVPFNLKKYIPSADTIRNSKSLGFMARFLDDPNLFHMNKRSVSMALFWGVFVGFLPPIPLHTPIVAVAALITRCNLPLAIASVWIGNPVTYPVIMFVSYYIGRFVLQIEPISSLEFSWAWLSSQFGLIWKPYLVGSLITAIFSATIVYYLSNFIWRLNVKRKWRARQQERQSRSQ